MQIALAAVSTKRTKGAAKHGALATWCEWYENYFTFNGLLII